MIPPDRRHLQALAGWAISVGGFGSDEQQGAVRRFKDSCSELAEHVEDIKVPRTSKQAELPKPASHKRLVAHEEREPSGVNPHVYPVEVAEYLGIVINGECKHKFDIRTQVCVGCGMTYREVLGRGPELF